MRTIAPIALRIEEHRLIERVLDAQRSARVEALARVLAPSR